MNRNNINILLLTIFSILISAFILDDEIRSFYSIKDGGINGILLSIRFFFMHALLIGVVIYSVIRLLKNKSRRYLFPIVVCLIHFAIVITLRIKLDIRESSPVVLQADYFDEINGLELSLRKNNTYKLRDFGYFGGKAYFGKYRIIGDTILLSEKYPLGEDRDIMSNKLVREKEFILIKQDSNGVYSKDGYFKLRIVKSF